MPRLADRFGLHASIEHGDRGHADFQCHWCLWGLLSEAGESGEEFAAFALVLPRLCALRFNRIRLGFRDEASEARHRQRGLFSFHGLVVDDHRGRLLPGKPQYLRSRGALDGGWGTSAADPVFLK